MNESNEFLTRLRAVHQALGIPADYIDSCALPLCREPPELVATEPDFYQRPQRLTPAAFAAWTAMKQQAAADQVTLFLISAFRDIDYQGKVIAAKLAEGRSMSDVLTVNAAPGFSEHHTGRAVDIGTPGCDALQLEFEETAAFQWLGGNASNFGFVMSYPPGNSLGIAYEPWHWCYRDEEACLD